MVRKPALRVLATATVGRSLNASRESRVVLLRRLGRELLEREGFAAVERGSVEPAIGESQQERRPRHAEPAHDPFRQERSDLGEAARARELADEGEEPFPLAEAFAVLDPRERGGEAPAGPGRT